MRLLCASAGTARIEPQRCPRRSRALGKLYAVEDLVIALRELGDAFAPERVAAMLRDVRVDERTLAPYLRWSNQRYTRNLVARNDAFEMIVMCWDAGSASPIHDHASSDCTFVLLSGTVRCEDFRVASVDADTGRTMLDRHASRRMAPGEIDLASGTTSIHRVAADDCRAMTLHVYAKPMDTCTNFTADGAAYVTTSRYDNRPA